MRPDISVIIVSWNRQQYLFRCLNSFGERLHSEAYEVIVVDNGSVDRSAEIVRGKFPSVKLIRNEENLGYAAANNIGLMHARGRDVAFLNSDVEIVEDALEVMMEVLEKDGSYGAVALDGIKMVWKG
jgi:GT2 family glycosyltransferase